jgi:serpin B
MDLTWGRFGRAALALTLGALPGAATVAAGEGLPARDAAESGEATGMDLYRIFSGQDGNVFFSPYSISEALALLSLGAGGRTQAEILRTLHWNRPADRLAAAFGAQDAGVEAAARDSVTLTVANGIWYQRGQAPRAPFTEAAQTAFHAEIRVADFAADLPVSQHMINYWVDRKTGGRIPLLVPPGALTPNTRLVLANAIYFKGRWAAPFAKERTAPKPFHTADGQSVLTPMMWRQGHCRSASADGCDLLELPYAGGALSMVIALPKTRDGLPALEQGLTAAGLSGWLGLLDAAGARQTDVTLPRFTMNFSVELTKALAQLGMVTAFVDREADFSPINGRRDLYVSAAFHKAFVDVNEEGTEAAAATGFGLHSLAVERAQAFNADHPFLFLIRCGSTGSVLFLGRVSDPRSS